MVKHLKDLSVHHRFSKVHLSRRLLLMVTPSLLLVSKEMVTMKQK